MNYNDDIALRKIFTVCVLCHNFPHGNDDIDHDPEICDECNHNEYPY